MEPAATIVYASVWMALLCYPAGAVGHAVGQPVLHCRARLVWSAGCVAFWLHVASAFAVFYHLSHAFALQETARQTLEATGFDSGAGLYLNYLFALLWFFDAAWWWWRPASYRRRPLAVFLLLQGFFLFMIFNGAVLFVSGPRRWLGLLVTVAGLLLVGWAVSRQRRRSVS